MSLLRVFLLWAIMVAVPFQGYAAASMLQCTPGAPLTAMGAAASGQGDEHHQHDTHDTHDTHDAQGASASTTAQDQHKHADTLHKCSTCGTCHAVALIAEPPWQASAVLPPADLADPARPVTTRAPHVLDKPPRA